MIQRKYLVAQTVFLLLGAAISNEGAGYYDPAGGVKITRLDDRLRIEIGGKLFSEYYFHEVSRPYFYPVIGPGGLPMTRNWPMKEAPDEDRDHPHHRSLWYAHGEVNGHDFWSESPKAGKTFHVLFRDIQSGKEAGSFTAVNQLVGRDGTVVGTQEFRVRIEPAENAVLMDFDVTFRASDGEIVLGDTKEGSMAIRVAETMRLQGKVGKGHIVNSEGVRDGRTWGKRAKWCDYYGPIQDKIVGVAIFDHPQNPRHPTWWHVRDYGLFAANPFGIHDFERKPAGTGYLKIPSGETATFRYRFYFHEGNDKQAGVEEQYQKYSRTAPPQKKADSR
jgi:hypothetical protein